MDDLGGGFGSSVSKNERVLIRLVIMFGIEPPSVVKQGICVITNFQVLA